MSLNCSFYLKNGNILNICPIKLVWGLNEITHGRSWEQLLAHVTYSVNNISWTIKIEFCQQSRTVNFKIGFKPISIMPNLFLFSFYFRTHFQPGPCPFSLSYVCHYFLFKNVFISHPPTTHTCSCVSSHWNYGHCSLIFQFSGQASTSTSTLVSLKCDVLESPWHARQVFCKLQSESNKNGGQWVTPCSNSWSNPDGWWGCCCPGECWSWSGSPSWLVFFASWFGSSQTFCAGPAVVKSTAYPVVLCVYF